MIETDFLTAQIINANHTLVAGASGSGKSTLIETLLYTLQKTNMSYSIIDLKKISLARWKKNKNCLRYATTSDDALKLINDYVATMEQRFLDTERKSLQCYDGGKLFLIIDEAADLLDSVPESKKELIKILRLGRASKISIIFATQSPDRKTIISQVQQNCDCLIGLRCRDAVASRQIIGCKGCETLPRYGKALIYTPQLMKPYQADVILTPDDNINHILNSP